MKLTPAERADFDRVLELRNEEVRRLTGEPITLTASDLLRRLIAKEVERLGIRPAAGDSRPPPPPEPEPPAPPAPKASPAKVPKASPSKGKIESGKGRRR
ncbi:MAG TPA: hypothetical protein VFS43_13300 [Polyangiaceae bacterium]|nr:hypothetical protein [Polyangiaceae bacterium]